ncbi:MAG TPA: hypothetical protein VE175_11820 [Woeseiaceae bacterium]|nr:hypothetical protein [Woeseiaceae bacterium]
MLALLQQYLTDIYQTDHGLSVTDFLITDPAVARLLGCGALMRNTEESVLLSRDKNGLALSVYLDEELLERLEVANPIEELRPEQLDDLCKVLEGISHFNYICWRARQDKPVKLLELEMQAEVDKFVSTWLMAFEQQDYELARRLHGWIFDEVQFHPDLDREQAERYRAANDYAARFCHGLATRLHRDGEKGLDELRHFYRLSQNDKISHIHAQAYGRS